MLNTELDLIYFCLFSYYSTGTMFEKTFSIKVNFFYTNIYTRSHELSRSKTYNIELNKKNQELGEPGFPKQLIP